MYQLIALNLTISGYLHILLPTFKVLLLIRQTTNGEIADLLLTYCLDLVINTMPVW